MTEGEAKDVFKRLCGSTDGECRTGANHRAHVSPKARLIRAIVTLQTTFIGRC